MTEERATNAVDMRLGQRLRARRLELSMSQEQLAERLGLTFQQVQKYEKGINRVAASRLFEIAAALDAPVSHFFEGLSAVRPDGLAEDGPTPYLHDELANPDGRALVELFARIKSPKLRRRVVELLRVLVEDEEGAADPPSA